LRRDFHDASVGKPAAFRLADPHFELPPQNLDPFVFNIAISA